ncbi:UvrD-helicase domain-containing protein [Steroidobacter sp.]|uniref:UvrD-helicase domain-containing protein n=1 Tax=Steroidobacter sp. TaxID=1978227 RepID=UPI001A5DDB2C|nr:ATP-dependent helicase [Steroidobacter sp.]MBL8269413.1 ATP-dependent helicase [Steroidobacter sp.]
MTRTKPEAWKPQGIGDLEPRAWEALREHQRSICVTAGAGAGKTEFLAQKAAYLLQTGLCPNPKRILAISFKRDAARTLSERVEKRCGPEQARRLDSFTFDAFTKGFIDRFRRAIPAPFTPPRNYRIHMPTRAQWDHFLQSQKVRNLNATQIERAVTQTRLPFDKDASQAVRRYWETQYSDADNVLLSFAMLNRLVDYLLREHRDIRRALQLTYPFVFLDEFQDTTQAQYELLSTAFDGSSTVFTAVGDDKQRIMEWAGAMPDAFVRFRAQFNAVPFALLSNWRSHEDLVRIQHVIARKIDASAELPQARAVRDVDGDVAAIWEYDAEAQETQGLARWIAGEISGGIPPHEVALLVRMRADQIEQVLAPTFADHGVSLRNVARQVGEIAIQDVLGEGLTEILLPLLRLGAQARDANAWSAAERNLLHLEGIYPDDEDGQQRLQARLQTFVRALRAEMSSATASPTNAKAIAQRVLDFVTSSVLRRAFPAYQREPDFDRVWEGFKQLLAESANGARDWSQVLDRFEGLGQVALMTIHKSKGLEFHTVLFYGLDSETWWSLQPHRVDELNSFFVAFTRARQRAFFTLCRSRGGPVTWVEQILAPAGVHRRSGPK